VAQHKHDLTIFIRYISCVSLSQEWLIDEIHCLKVTKSRCKIAKSNTVYKIHGNTAKANYRYPSALALASAGPGPGVWLMGDHFPGLQLQVQLIIAPTTDDSARRWTPITGTEVLSFPSRPILLSIFLPFPPLSSPPFPLPSLLSAPYSSLISLSFPLAVGPLNPARESGGAL